MQPDFFEDPETTHTKHLIRRRKELSDQIDAINEEITRAFKDANSMAIDYAGSLYLVTLPSGRSYIYELDGKRPNILHETDLQKLVLAATTLLNKQQDTP